MADYSTFFEVESSGFRLINVLLRGKSRRGTPFVGNNDRCSLQFSECQCALEKLRE